MFLRKKAPYGGFFLFVIQDTYEDQEIRQRSIMEMNNIPFGLTNWDEIETERFEGENGFAIWRTQRFGTIRVRMVEYSAGYIADHWCSKGHILFCLEGELHTELQDGRVFTLKAGMSYQVADMVDPHRSYSDIGARLFIVD